MAKIIAWLILIFVVLLALRMISMRNARARRRAAGAGVKANPGAPMVRCVRCGVFLPRAEAVTVNGEHACADTQCASR
jgi:ribosomal protein S26